MASMSDHWVKSQGRAFFYALLIGSWIGAGVAGWWLSVPVPVTNSTNLVPMFVYGILAAGGMGFLWLHLTGLQSWWVAFQQGLWLVVSSAVVFLAAAIRGTTSLQELGSIWRSVIVDNHQMANLITVNPWWCSAIVQVLVVVSLWLCTLKWWKHKRWGSERLPIQENWMPTLVAGGSGLLIVSGIHSAIAYRYRYPYFGPAASIELAEYTLEAVVFSLLFPLVLLWLQDSNWWRVGHFWSLLGSLWGLWFAEANWKCIRTFLHYSQTQTYENQLWFTLGCLVIYSLLGAFLFAWRMRYNPIVEHVQGPDLEQNDLAKFPASSPFFRPRWIVWFG